MSYVHLPVLLEEVINSLITPDTKHFMDCTLGEGGHSAEIMTRFSGIIVYGLDRNKEILDVARNRLSVFKNRFHSFNINFTDVSKQNLNIDSNIFDAALIDLGISVFHYKKSNKGFSFGKDEKLDMRLDKDGISAFDIVNQYSKESLQDIFYKYGEERFSRRIADFIIKARDNDVIDTSIKLAGIISDAIPKKYQPKKIHPATRVFQALRIFINDEFENIKIGIPKILSLLKKGGRLGVITFHSIEDRIVKHIFADLNKDCVCPKNMPICTCNKHKEIKWINKLIIPGEEEININPPSRSAKFRVVEKL